MIKINNCIVDSENFPNGESKIYSEIYDNNEDVNITWKFENDTEIFHLQCIVDDIKSDGMTLGTLYLPYIPYSRMDRKESSRIVFTLKTFCNIINGMGFKNVFTYEPHSDVCVALLNRVLVSSLTEKLVLNATENGSLSEYVIVYPDAGAHKRYSKLFPKCNTLVGFKTRDFDTGKINGVNIVGDIPSGVKKAIIVDDLSSYGGTFIATGKKLKEMGIKEVKLVVTHCENSILNGEIPTTDIISKVFTTNSIYNGKCDKIIVYPV